MAMFNPPHPGEFIEEVYLKPFGFSGQLLAKKLDVSPLTVSQILSRQAAVTPEMALRLSIALGRSPESWLAMQHNYDLWQLRQSVDLRNVHRVEFATD